MGNLSPVPVLQLSRAPKRSPLALNNPVSPAMANVAKNAARSVVNMKRFAAIGSLIFTFAWCLPAFAQNNCEHGADYTTSAVGGVEDSAAIRGAAGDPMGIGSSWFCQAAVTNNTAAPVWAMIFDAGALPANGTIPKLEFNVPATSTRGEYGYPMLMPNGVTIACSSTQDVLTVTVGADCHFHVTLGR